MTVFAEANVDVDLRMLRSFRVLRPLKLVSRIPSKHFRPSIFSYVNDISSGHTFFFHLRSEIKEENTQ